MALGHWAKTYLNPNGGGTELPSVTASDNGKVLGVDGGEYKLVEQSGGGTPSIKTVTVASDGVVAIAGGEYKQVTLTVPSTETIPMANITGIDVKVSTTKGGKAGVMCSLTGTDQSSDKLTAVRVNLYNTETIEFQPYVLAYVHYLSVE